MKLNKLIYAALTSSITILATILPANAAQWEHDRSDLSPESSVQWGELDNGLRYIIMPWTEPADRVSLRLVIDAGSLEETDAQQGLAHFIEHMAFNGTKNYSSGEMVEYFQRLGMDFGADTNAHTWWGETVYKLELPDNNEDLINDGIQLLRDYADGMIMDPAEIEKERGVVISEMRDRNSAAMKAYKEELGFSLPDSRISQRLTIGDKEILQTAPQSALLDYYRKWYTPSRIILIAVGDINPEEIEAKFKANFASMEAAEEPVENVDLGEIVPVESKFRLYSNPELSTASLGVYARRQVEDRPDTIDFRMERIKVDLANAIMDRRFEKLSKQENSPIISGSAYDYRWLDFARFTGVETTMKPESWEDALELVVTELKKATEFGFSEAELNEAKANLINNYEQTAQRASTRKSRDISSSLVRSVMDGFVFVAPETSRDIFVPKIEAIQLAEVEEAFRSAWDIDERLVFLSGNFETGVEEAFKKAKALEVTPPNFEEMAEFAYTDFGPAGTVVEKNKIEDLDAQQIVFENNVHLNIKKTDFEAGKVAVKIRFGSGLLEAPQDKPGLTLAASSIFIPGGLGKHSIDELQQLTAGKTVGLGFQIDDGAFILSGTTNKEDLLLQLQLFAAYLSDPGYRPEAERLMRKQVDTLYNQLSHNPQGVIQNEVARYLAGGDKRFGYPEQAELLERTTEEVKTWLQSALNSGYLEMAVVGDYGKAEDVINAVAQTIGALPERESELPNYKDARKVGYPESEGLKTFTYNSDLDRSIAMVVWPTVGYQDIEEVRRLSVLASVFSDRMRIEIREAFGDAYSPYAVNTSNDTFEEYGLFRAIAGIEPNKSERIIETIEKIASDIKENGISEDEIVRAIEPIKTQIKEYRRTNDYWAGSVLLNSQNQPERLDWARSFMDFWGTVTPEQVDELAEKYLKAESTLPIRVLPQS